VHGAQGRTLHAHRSRPPAAGGGSAGGGNAAAADAAADAAVLILTQSLARSSAAVVCSGSAGSGGQLASQVEESVAHERFPHSAHHTWAKGFQEHRRQSVCGRA
jgi:hypothetical protein